MAEVVSTIKSSGGDYSSLQDWWDDVKGSTNPEQTAEVYSGFDAGGLTWTSMASATVTSSAHPIIRVADGEGHEGKIPSTATDVAYANGKISAVDSYYEINGLYIKNSNTTIGVGTSKAGWTVKNCLLHDTSTSVHKMIDYTNWQNNTADTITITGNIIRSDATSNASTTALIYSSGNNARKVAIYNNTIVCDVDCIGILLSGNNSGWGATQGNVNNNAVFVGSGGSCYATANDAWQGTADYNGGSDGTATSVLGGSNNEDSIDATDQFTDETDDWTLLGTADLLGAGVDVSLTYDAIGTEWGDPPSIGALEYVSSGPTGTNMQINISDTWKDVSAMQINIGDTWKDVTKVQVNIGDTWKTVF